MVLCLALYFLPLWGPRSGSPGARRHGVQAARRSPTRRRAQGPCRRPARGDTVRACTTPPTSSCSPTPGWSKTCSVDSPAPGWSDSLDFATLEKLPSEFVSEDLRRRSGDGVWRVRFRDEWLYVLVLLEFQSTVDRHMALRILVYTGLLYQDLIRREAAGADGRLPPVLPVVLYNGSQPWTAPVDMSELIVPVGEDLSRYQPVQRYFVLDGGIRRDDDLPRRQSGVGCGAA